MKTTLFFKRIDFWLQIVALLVPLLDMDMWRIGRFHYIGFYISVGATQVVSCFFNRVFLEKDLRNKTRVGYEITLLLIFIVPYFLSAIKSTKPADICFDVIMVISPFMAVWYGAFSYLETRYIKRLATRKDFV